MTTTGPDLVTRTADAVAVAVALLGLGTPAAARGGADGDPGDDRHTLRPPARGSRSELDRR